MEVKAQPQNKMDKLLSDSEFNRFGLIAVILVVVGCLGGTAVGLGAVASVVTLALVIIPTMATLSLLLAVSPMRYVLTAAAISTVIDIALILFYSFT